MADANHGEKDLEQENGEGEESDRVEDLLLDQEGIPPVSHLRTTLSSFVSNRERIGEELQARLACMSHGCRKIWLPCLPSASHSRRKLPTRFGAGNCSRRPHRTSGRSLAG